MFRKFLISFGIAASIIGSAQAQIPVTDGAAIATAQANSAAAIAKYVEQIVQLKAQLDQAKMMFDNLNGLRNIGGLMQNQLLSQYLPPDFQQAYNALKSGQGGSMAGVSGSLNQIASMYQAQNCNQYATAQAQAGCRSAWQTYSMNQYIGEQGYQQSAQNIQNLQSFVDSIKQSPDAKSMQDLQARISVEQVKLQNEQLKLQTVQMMMKAQEDRRKQNASDNTVRMLQGNGAIRF